MDVVTLSLANRRITNEARGAQRLVPVSSRGGNVYLGLSGTGYAQPNATYRVKHVATDDITSLRLYYGNWYYSSDGLYHDGVSVITVKAMVTLADGSQIPGFTTTGGRSLSIDVGGYGYLDVPVNIAKGAVFYEDCYLSVPAAGQWVLGLKTNYARQGTISAGTTGVFDTNGSGDTGDTLEGTNLSSGGDDLTTIGSAAVATNFMQAYSAFAVMGTVNGTRRRSAVGYIGDSILTDSNDFSGTGFLWRALGPGVSRIRLSHGGDQLAYWLTQTKRLWKTAFLRNISHAFHNHGRNDLALGTVPLATIQANMIASWLLTTSYGSAAWQVTILPGSTSTNNFIDLANQTTVSWNAARVSVNNWLRDGAPMSAGVAVAVGTAGASRCAVYDKTGARVTAASGAAHPLTGVLETADVVESSRDSGKWDVSTVRTITDVTTDVSTTDSKYRANSPSQGAFTAADQGKVVILPGSGTAGATLTLTVMQVASATQLKFSAQMVTAVSGGSMTIGIPTTDGTHPNPDTHRRIAASGALAPFLATLIT